MKSKWIVLTSLCFLVTLTGCTNFYVAGMLVLCLLIVASIGEDDSREALRALRRKSENPPVNPLWQWLGVLLPTIGVFALALMPR